MNNCSILTAWKAADLAATGDHMQIVGDRSIDRLARELPLEFHVPRSEVSRSEFRLQITGLLNDLAEELIARVRSGLGLAILVGAGLERLSDDQLAAMLYGLSILIGRPLPQNPAGDLVASVRDQHAADVENARGYLTNEKMLLHTDPADVAALLCLHQSDTGGANLFSSSAAVHDALTDAAPGTIHEYYRLWEWNLSGLKVRGENPTLPSPIFSYYAGELSCHYGSRLIRDGALRAGVQLTTAQVAALDLFEQVAQCEDLSLRHTLRRGESVWMNNYRILHGRDAFGDGSSRGSTRHLLRAWIWLNEGPRLAPDFASLDFRIFGHDRTLLPTDVITGGFSSGTPSPESSASR